MKVAWTSVSNTDNVSIGSHSDSRSSLDVTIESKEGLKCLYTNIDCVSNKWTELETLIYIQQPDLIGVTELFSKSQESVNLSAYSLEGFQQFVNPRFCDNNYSRGTMLFIKDEIEVSLYDRLNDFSCKEACWCIINLNKTEKLLVVYRRE